MISCAKCEQEINDDYIVAETKNYHIDHLLCEVCKQSLLGKTYIKKDRIYYCEDDFYASFAKMCCKCKELIKKDTLKIGEFYYHVEHFTCNSCLKPLATYEDLKSKDALIKKLIMTCYACDSNVYHIRCYKCSLCKNQINNG